MFRLLLVTGDGCDSADADYRYEAGAYAAVKSACDDLQPDYETRVTFSDPIDGHGIIYTLTMCARTGEPELWTLYRYQVTEVDEDFPVDPTPNLVVGHIPDVDLDRLIQATVCSGETFTP